MGETETSKPDEAKSPLANEVTADGWTRRRERKSGNDRRPSRQKNESAGAYNL